MDNVDQGRLKRLLKIVAITNLISSGIITYEEAIRNLDFKEFLKKI